jgi:hypothetical protein
MTLNPDQLNATILAAERAVAHAQPRSPEKEALSEAHDCLLRAQGYLQGPVEVFHNPRGFYSRDELARVLAEQAHDHVQWAKTNG